MKVHRRRGERGTAAVEFALVIPVLLILVMGIIEFGRAYYVQTVLSGAAREGVRAMALQNNATAARTATKNAGYGLTLTDAQIAVSTYPYNTPGTATATPTCTVTGTTPASTASVAITYPMTYITKFFGTSITLTGKGVMLCNG